MGQLLQKCKSFLGMYRCYTGLCICPINSGETVFAAAPWTVWTHHLTLSVQMGLSGVKPKLDHCTETEIRQRGCLHLWFLPIRKKNYQFTDERIWLFTSQLTDMLILETIVAVVRWRLCQLSQIVSAFKTFLKNGRITKAFTWQR